MTNERMLWGKRMPKMYCFLNAFYVYVFGYTFRIEYLKTLTVIYVQRWRGKIYLDVNDMPEENYVHKESRVLYRSVNEMSSNDWCFFKKKCRLLDDDLLL